MIDKVHPLPFRVPELLETQLTAVELCVLNWTYECERRRKQANRESQPTHKRDSRVWDDVQALLNSLRWMLDDVDAREDMPDRIHELAKRIAKTIDE